MVKLYGLTMWVIAGAIFCSSLSTVEAFPHTFEQRQRLKKYIPRAFAKLERKEPVRVVALGGGNIFAESIEPTERVSGNAIQGFTGVFLKKMAREFFYTGEVRFRNPPKGLPEKKDDFEGPEIDFVNLGKPNASILNGLQRIKGDVFVEKPDLILLQFGSSDALRNMPLYSYRRALHHLIEDCKAKRVDLIVFGPAPVNRGGGAMEWGITRPYSSATKQICYEHQVLFIDSGQALVRFGGAIDPNADAMGGMAVVGDRLKNIFYIQGSERSSSEIQHLNNKAHKDLGDKAFHELVNGSLGSDFSAAGKATFLSKGQVEVIISIRNQAKDRRSGILGAFKVGGFIPKLGSQSYSLEPGETTDITFVYNRKVVGKTGTGERVYHPCEINSGVLELSKDADGRVRSSDRDQVTHFPFIIEDGGKSEFIDLPLRIGPVAIKWKSHQYVGINDQFRVDWEMINGTDKGVDGTYRISYGKGRDQARQFSIPPLGSFSAAANLRFAPPTESDCFQTDVSLEVEIGGETYRFTREMEASRDLALGEAVIMANGRYGAARVGTMSNQSNGWAPSCYFEGSAKSGLFAIADISGLKIPKVDQGYAIRAKLYVDGRAKGRVRGFGAVSPITLGFTTAGGQAKVHSVPLGAFGDGYNKRLSSSGIGAVLKGDQIKIRIPSNYLDQFGWQLAADSILGVRLELAVVDPRDNSFPVNRTFYTNLPMVYDGNEFIRGMPESDARGLSTLRFSRQPVNLWSLRLY